MCVRYEVLIEPGRARGCEREAGVEDEGLRDSM